MGFGRLRRSYGPTFETDNDLTEQLLTQHNNNFEYEKKYVSDRFGTIKYIHLKK